MATHAVSFYQRDEVPWILYRPAKILAELLNRPAAWFGKGHEIIVFLRVRSSKGKAS